MEHAGGPPLHTLLDLRSLEELLAGDGVRGQIGELRARMGAALPVQDPVGVQFDEVFLLRFVLSFKTADEAEPHLRNCVEWRMANETILRAARANHVRDQAAVDALMPRICGLAPFMSGKLHPKVTLLGGPVYVIRGCLSDDKALVRYMTEHGFDVLRDYMLLMRETSFTITDSETRRTGKMVKMQSWYDMSGMAIQFDKRLMSEMGAVSKISESLFPQLLQAVVILNAPSIVRGMMSLARPFFSQRLLEKIHFCGSGSTSSHTAPKDAIQACPIVSRLLAVDAVPSFLGGQCNCPGGCVCAPNSQRIPTPPLEADGKRRMTVGARTTVPVFFDVPARATLVVSVCVENSGGDVPLRLLQRSLAQPAQAAAAADVEIRRGVPELLNSSQGSVDISAGPFDERSELELRLENTGRITSKVVSYSATVTCPEAAAAQAARVADGRRSVVSGGSQSPRGSPKRTGALVPRALSAEWSPSLPLPRAFETDDADDDDSDEFHDAQEVLIIPTATDIVLLGRGDSVMVLGRDDNAFGLTEYESSLSKERHKDRRSRRHLRKERGKGSSGGGVLACCAASC